MPHLSPMLWLFSSLLFILTSMIMMSSTWWMHYAYFPYTNGTKPINTNNWNWK